MTLTAAPSVFDPSLCIPDLKLRKKDSALAEMIGLAHLAGAVRTPALLVDLLKWRERLGTTALGKGVAVPSIRSIGVLRPQIVAARSPRGIEWNAPDDQLVTLVLLALSPAEASEDTHHALIARAVSAGRLQRTRQRIACAATAADVAVLLREATA